MLAFFAMDAIMSEALILGEILSHMILNLKQVLLLPGLPRV